MLTYFSKIDPNLVAAVLALALGIVYHHLSPATRAGISDASASTLADVTRLLDTLMGAIRTATRPGTTVADLENALWEAAKPQLAHVGFDVDKMPPAAKELVQALIRKWTTGMEAPPVPAAMPGTLVTAVTIVPAAPAAPGTSEAVTPAIGVPTPKPPA